MNNKQKKKLDKAMNAMFGLSVAPYVEPAFTKDDLDRKLRMGVDR